MNETWKLGAAGLVALGLAAGGFLAGQGLVQSRLGFRTVTVKGLAEKPVKADLGFWPIRFVATGGDLETARQSLEQSEAAVRAYLVQKGFKPEEIQIKNIKVQDRFTDYSNQVAEGTRFVLTEDILVTSKDVDKLAAASRTTGDLLRSGVVFASDEYNAGPSYVFTGLNAMKAELLAEATKRAREAAQTFAQQSGARVGGIQNASQGVIEVNPAVEIPDENANKQIDKSVRVVTTITYFLKD